MLKSNAAQEDMEMSLPELNEFLAREAAQAFKVVSDLGVPKQ
jgi:hypothetical protein